MSAPFGCIVYSATKAAPESFTMSMARELGEHNIRVNAICPGMTNTPLIASAAARLGPGLEAIMQRRIIQRVIETNDIADLVPFLLSPLSAMITGEAVVIDGALLVG